MKIDQSQCMIRKRGPKKTSKHTKVTSNMVQSIAGLAIIDAEQRRTHMLYAVHTTRKQTNKQTNGTKLQCWVLLSGYYDWTSIQSLLFERGILWCWFGMRHNYAWPAKYLFHCKSNGSTWIFSPTNTNNKIYSNTQWLPFIQLIPAHCCGLLFVQIFCNISTIINNSPKIYLFTNTKTSAIEWVFECAVCKNLFKNESHLLALHLWIEIQSTDELHKCKSYS